MTTASVTLSNDCSSAAGMPADDRSGADSSAEGLEGGDC
jgi:hypothetical protein